LKIYGYQLLMLAFAITVAAAIAVHTHKAAINNLLDFYLAHPFVAIVGIQLDKWQIGPLRVINLVTFSIVFYWLRKYLLRWVAIEPFLTLGKASLQVFCTSCLCLLRPHVAGPRCGRRRGGTQRAAPLTACHCAAGFYICRADVRRHSRSAQPPRPPQGRKRSRRRANAFIARRKRAVPGPSILAGPQCLLLALPNSSNICNPFASLN